MPIFHKLDKIAIYSTDLQGLNSYGQQKVREFVNDVNKDLVNLNDLIKKFNQENNPAEKIIILTKIYQEQIRIDDQHSPEYMSYCEDYRDKIHNGLFKEIKRQFKDLGIDSLPEQLPSEKLPKGAGSSPLPTVLANMAPEKANKLLSILAEGKYFAPCDLQKLYNRGDPGYKEFNNFLSTHSISFLGGGNSKNFKVINNLTNEEFILKVDNRLGMPKGAAAHLREHALKDVLTPIVAERQTTYTDKKGRAGIRTLMITEFCHGGDLESHGRNLKTQDQARLMSALSIYTQMGAIVESIRSDGCAFPDMKNTNWLIDSNDTVRLADTKSFLFIEKNGDIDKDSPKNKWYRFISTRYMNPPEFTQSTPFSADKSHSYMLGKNLYQYLSNCKYEEFGEGNVHNNWVPFHDASQLDYSAPIFNTPHGKELKKLIMDMVRPNPNDRISVTEALSRLEKIQFSIEKENCTSLVKQIETLAKQTHGKNSKLETSLKEILKNIKSAANLVDLLSIKKQLEGAENELLALKTERENFRQLLTILESLTIECGNNAKEAQRYIKKTLKEVNSLKLDEILKIKTKLEEKVDALQRLKTAREHCYNLFDEMETLEIKANKKLNHIQEHEIDRATDVNELSGMKDELEKNLAELTKLYEAKQECRMLLREFKGDSVEPFITETLGKVLDAQNTPELMQIKENLVKILKLRKECKSALEIFSNAYKDLRETFTFIVNMKSSIRNIVTVEEAKQIQEQITEKMQLMNAKVEIKADLDRFKDTYGANSEDYISGIQTKIFMASKLEQLMLIKTEIEIMSTAMEQYKLNLNDLKEYKLGPNDANIDKIAQNQIKQMKQVTNLDQVQKGVEQLNSDLSSIKEDIKIKQVKDNCTDVLRDIEQYRFGPQDSKMNEFIKGTQDAIKRTISEAEAIELYQKLHNTLSTMKNDGSLKELREIISSFRSNAHFYTYGMKEKAKGIEDAMSQVPIEKRKNIYIENDDTREVLKQLASNRKIWGNSSTPLKKETTTEEVTKEVIDETKAAQSFKDFKNKFKEIQPKQEAPEVDETLTQQLKK